MKINNGDFLYLTTLIPDNEFSKLIILDQKPQIATHKFHWKVFKAIKSSNIIDFNFHILSTSPMSDYPKCKIKLVRDRIWESKEFKIHQLFFINIPVIKTITIFISCLYHCILWGIKTKNKNKRGVYIGSLQLPYLICGFLISKFYNIPFFGILTDPPNMNYKIEYEASLKTKLRYLYGKTSLYFINRIEAVIALTKYLVLDFCPNSKNIIIEAISEEVANNNKGNNKNNNFIITYAGSLLKVYGILNLLEAFTLLKYDDIELWIFGSGDVETEIMKYVNKDSRIKYFGFCENSQVLYYQSISTLLVNPRPTNLPDGKYSFPSKLLEYMQSGKVTLTTKLEGIPEEYDKYLYYFDNYSITSISDKIKELYYKDRDELITLGQKAKIFAETKSILHQGSKISHFILDVIGENKV